MADSVTVLRADDLLSLKFDFVNLKIVKAGAQSHLARISGGPAFIVVHFAPQNIGDQAFFEKAGEFLEITKNPYTIDFKTGKPRPDRDQGTTTEDPLPPPVKSRISGSSRLAFKVPSDVATIPFTLEELLKRCAEYDLSVAATALPRARRITPIVIPGFASEAPVGAQAALAPSTTQIAVLARATLYRRRSQLAQLQLRVVDEATWVEIEKSFPGSPQVAPKITQPALTETAIESPYRLVVSPNGYGAWVHALKPVSSRATGRTELWHTRLATRLKGQVDELHDDLRTVRAIWTQDSQFNPNSAFAVPPHEPSGQEKPFRLPLDFSDRHHIVHLTSNYKILKYVPDPVDVDRLMLTTLGSWMDMRGAWLPPKNPDHPDTGLAVEEWRQRGTMGRDHLVRVVYNGYLYGFGHRASLVKVTERKFHPNKPGNPVYNRQRMFLVPRQPERYYQYDFPDHDQRPNHEFPFVRIRITTLVTPNLDPPQEEKDETQSLFWPRVDGTPFLFGLVAEGLDGKELRFVAPLLFADATQTPHEILKHFQKAEFRSFRKRSFEGQPVVFAPSNRPGDTTLDTESITFNAVLLNEANKAKLRPDEPRLYPRIEKASVAVPTLKHLGRNNALTDIEYHDFYRTDGFTGNQGEVFCKILSDTAKLDFNSQGNRTGGLVKPNLQLTALSRLLGPVGGDPGLVRGGKFDPKSFFGNALDPKIFGVIKLSELIPEVPDLQNLDLVPKFMTEVLAGFETFAQNLDKLQQLIQNPQVPSGTLPQKITDLKNALLNLAKDFTDQQAANNLKALLTTPHPFADDVLALGAALPAGAGFADLKKLCSNLAQDLQNVTDFVKNFTSDEITIRLDWQPKIAKWGLKGILKPNDPDDQALFLPHPKGGLLIAVELKAKKNNPAEASLDVFCRLWDFSLDLIAPASLIALHFDKIEFFAGNGKKADVNVVFNGIEFVGVLAFVETLRRMIPFNGFSDPPALEVTEEGIDASFSMGLPTVAVGVFSLQNLSLGAGFTVPFIGEPLSVRFNFCERHQPFALTVWVFGGGGFLGLTLDPGGVQILEAALEFGASCSIDLGVASGGVHIMAGIYFKMVSLEASLTGYLRLGGEVCVLGIISVSIEMYMDLTYEFSSGLCVGRATITVEIEIAFFSETVEVSCERKFAGSSKHLTFAEIMAPAPPIQPWQDYCEAFA